MYNAGDFDTTETVIIPINTFTSDDPAASCTITDFAAGDVEIHKDGSTTQRSSDSGVSVSINFDGVTGNHIISIDLSDNTDAGFYANGSRYLVRIEGVTVDGGTLNAWVGGFSIGCTLRPTTAGVKLDVAATGEAGLDFNNIKDATGAHTLANITVPTVTTVGTCTTNSDMRGTDSAALASVCTEARLAELGSANIPADVDSLLSRLSAARAGYLDELAAANIPADIDSLLSRLSAARAGYLDELAAANIPADIDTIKGYLDTEIAAILAAVDTEVAAIKAVTDLLPDAGALSSLATATNQTTLLARLTAARAGYLDYINTINTALLTSFAEVTSKPAAGAAALDKLAFLFHAAVNKATFNKTTGVHTMYQSNGSSTLGTRSALIDDGTTVTSPAVT